MPQNPSSSKVCGEISSALHNADLQANVETDNQQRARENAESDAMMFNPDTPQGRLITTQIINITKHGGNLAVRMHHAFGAYQQRYFNGFGTAAETAPASTATHLYEQAANYSPKFLQECHAEHIAMYSASRKHGKVIYKPKFMNQVTAFYYTIINTNVHRYCWLHIETT